MAFLSEPDRSLQIIASLPAEHVARYRLGLWLETLMRVARINRTAGDEAFLRELARRFADQHDPDMCRHFLKGLQDLF